MLWPALTNGRQGQQKAKCIYNNWRAGEMDVKAKIKDVLVDLLKVKPQELKDDLNLQSSIGVDSTEMVETVIALEKAFGVKLSPKEISKFSTINEIEKNIQSKLQSQVK
jgi:acyl carrier protein